MALIYGLWPQFNVNNLTASDSARFCKKWKHTTIKLPCLYNSIRYEGMWCCKESVVQTSDSRCYSIIMLLFASRQESNKIRILRTTFLCVYLNLSIQADSNLLFVTDVDASWKIEHFIILHLPYDLSFCWVYTCPGTLFNQGSETKLCRLILESNYFGTR